MNRNILFVIVATIFIFDFAYSGLIRNVDNFTPDFSPPNIATTYLQAPTDLAYQIQDGDDTIGTERDSILYLSAGSYYLPVVSTINNGSWGIGWQQFSLGYAQLQYDGFDNSPILNLNPGLGGVDLTSSNAANGFILQISSDHPSPYIINVYGPTTNVVSTYAFECPATAQSVAFDAFYIPFSYFTGNALFSNVWGIELTLNISLATESAAIDSTVLTFATFSYEIAGTAFADCNANGIFDITESGFAGANVTVTSSPGNNVVATGTTNVNGSFAFVGLGNGTFTVCVTSHGSVNTKPSTGCTVVTLQNFNDSLGLLFGLDPPITVTAPPTFNTTCGSCVTPACGTGTAVVTGCGNVNPTPTYSDSNSTSLCPLVITRTWSAPGTSSTSVQKINVIDTAPTIATPAQNVTENCSNPSLTLASWVANHAGAVASTCYSVTWSNNWNGVTPTTCTSVSVNYTATDPCGLTVKTLGVYTIIDTVSPSFGGGPVNSGAACSSSGSDISAFNSWLSSSGNSHITDNCTPASSIALSNNYITGSITTGCFSEVTVAFTATDLCGNSNTQTASFTIQDQTAPSISGAKSSSSVCTGPGANAAFTSWLNTHAGATATDACTSSSLITWSNNFGTGNPATCNSATTVTFTATDSCGLSSSVTASFTITDSSPPNLIKSASSTTVPCSSNSTVVPNEFNAWLANNGGAVANDTCTITVAWSNNAVPFTASFCGSQTVTFTASDLCSPPKSIATTAVFTVTDTIAPVYSPGASNLTVDCSSDTVTEFNNWLSSQGSSFVSDNCASTLTLTNNYKSTLPPSGCNAAAVVTFSAADGCGNKAFTTATFTVVDTTAPQFVDSPQNELVQCNTTARVSYVTWLAASGFATVTDNCNKFSVTNNGPSSINSGCLVVQTVTFTATDACGNANSQTATFTVQDSAFPKITTSAKNLNVSCTTSNSSLSTWLNTQGGAVASDACTGQVTWTNNFQSLVSNGSCEYFATVTFAASDTCGFTSYTTATFIAVDDSIPTITRPAQPLAVPCTNGSVSIQSSFETWLSSHASAQATDPCVPASSLIWTNDFSTELLPAACGSVTVTFFVSDPCGGTAATTAAFSVTDKTAPTFSPQPQSITVNCDGYGNFESYADWVANSAGALPSDNCAVSLKVTNNAPTNGPVGCGTVTVTFTATDSCGNVGRSTASYTVVDDVAPVFVSFPQNLQEQCNPTLNPAQLQNWLVTAGNASITDACVNFAVSNNYGGALVSASACEQVATVTFTATDACGKKVAALATFSTIDTLAPNVTTPATPIVIQCSADSQSQLAAWIATHGGAVAVDQCTAVKWSNNFNSSTAVTSCNVPVNVTFTATDVCGNAAVTTASFTLGDTVPPLFVRFPDDVELTCDQCSTVECLGTPIAADACYTNIPVTYVDRVTNGPTLQHCPGNQLIERTFYASDPCGNSVSEVQNIVVQLTASAGPCNPDQCPPCNHTSCCTQPLTQVACNPVACNPVACNPVACIRVPCTPVTAAQCVAPAPAPVGNPVAPLPYGGGLGNNNNCEPIYIYIFDDDDNGQGNGKVNYEYVYVEVLKNSAVKSFAPLILIVFAIFAFF